VTLAVLSLAAAIVVSCNLAGGLSAHGHHPSTSTPGSTTPKTTTTVMPTSFNVGIHTFDWKETGPGIWHVGPGGQELPGRVLTTEVRYPTVAGSTGTEAVNVEPSTVGGPYPVIVFAHGFETEPVDYQALLDSWVKVGFVVVSPIFPDESTAAVDADGGRDDTGIADTLENDAYNEPGDIVYVLKQLQTIGTQPWGANLSHVLNLSDVGLAGQSDGANVVGALAYAPGLAPLYAGLPTAPKAVAVLSGFAWSYLPGKTIGTYRATAASPALLQVQSDADGCVPSPKLAVDMFASLQTGLASKWFVTLLGADHLGPYQSVAPWAAVVDAVTTTFFEVELNWRASSLSASSVQSAGTVSGAAVTTTTVNETTMPTVNVIPGCGIPS